MNRGIALLLFSTALPASAAKVLPILQHQIPDQRTGTGSAVRTLQLGDFFSTEPIDDQVVRFTYPSPTGGAPLLIDMALLTSKAPLSRANFLGYVTRGDYNRSIIHRHANSFVLQGGGYTVSTSNVINAIAQQPPVANEYGVSNTYGTVAMAKLGTSPDSATSQWFINLGDNSDNLNNQNGGFTVFAKVTKSTLPTVAAFTNTTEYPLFNFGASAGGAFTSTPLYKSFLPAASSRGPNLNEWELASTVALAPISPSDASDSSALNYSFSSTPAVGIGNIVLQGSTLSISPNAGQTSPITVKITATDSVGNTAEDTFNILPLQTYAAWRTATFSSTDATNDAVSGPNADPDGDGVPNLELFLHGLPPGRTAKPPVSGVDISADFSHRPRFAFAFRNDIAGASYTIEKTATLTDSASWTTVPFTEISRTTALTIDTVTIQPTDPVDTTPAFYRVKFTVE